MYYIGVNVSLLRQCYRLTDSADLLLVQYVDKSMLLTVQVTGATCSTSTPPLLLDPIVEGGR